MDLIVLGIRFHGAVGPVWKIDPSQTTVGATARIGTTLKYRLNRNTGPSLRIQLGGDYLLRQFNPTVEIQLGFDLAVRIKPPSGVDD
jgi:hypothetical protein